MPAVLAAVLVTPPLLIVLLAMPGIAGRERRANGSDRHLGRGETETGRDGCLLDWQAWVLRFRVASSVWRGT